MRACSRAEIPAGGPESDGLGFDPVLGPVGFADEVEAAVFLGVEGSEAGEALLEAGDAVEFAQDGVVDSVADRGAELLAQAGGGEVVLDRSFDPARHIPHNTDHFTK